MSSLGHRWSRGVALSFALTAASVAVAEPGDGEPTAETPTEAKAPPAGKFSEADAAYAGGDHAAALKAYRAAAKERPSDASARYRLAVTAATQKLYTEAERAAAAAARLDPGNAAAESLAVAAWAAHRREVPAKAPTPAEVERALADGRARAALQQADAALAERPSPSVAARLHRARGRALVALGRPAEGLSALRQAGPGGPRDTVWYQEIAQAARAAGDSAADAYQRWAERLDPRGDVPVGPLPAANAGEPARRERRR